MNTFQWMPLREVRVEDAEIERVGTATGIELERAGLGRVFVNDRYQVALRRYESKSDGPDLLHLSIKRLDNEPVRDWRDLQRIKNDLLGDEVEAVELYPAESRKVDTANQFHLWGFDDPTFQWPVGFAARRVGGETPPGGAQRPL